MNNVWHTPIFIPDPFKAHPIIVIYEAGDKIEQMMSNEYRKRVGGRYVNRWCYVNDLLNCEKALAIAVDALKISRDCAVITSVARGLEPKEDEINIAVTKALEQITALEQKEVK